MKKKKEKVSCHGISITVGVTIRGNGPTQKKKQTKGVM